MTSRRLFLSLLAASPLARFLPAAKPIAPPAPTKRPILVREHLFFPHKEPRDFTVEWKWVQHHRWSNDTNLALMKQRLPNTPEQAHLNYQKLWHDPAATHPS